MNELADLRLDPIEARIVKLLADCMPVYVPQIKIAEKLNLSRDAIAPRIQPLIDRGLIDACGKGRRKTFGGTLAAKAAVPHLTAALLEQLAHPVKRPTK